MEEEIIAEFPWPSRTHPEELCRVSVRDYLSGRAVEIYPRFQGIDGTWKSGNGVVFRPEELEPLRLALEQAAAVLKGGKTEEPAGVRRDLHGTIVNAEELTVAEVKHQPVLCPACREKVFKKWPEGWDGHAGFKCRGVTGTEEEKKAEFRRRFAHLFVR